MKNIFGNSSLILWALIFFLFLSIFVIIAIVLKNKELRIILPSKKLKFYSCLNSKEVYDIIIDLIKNEPFEEKNSYNSNTKAIKEYKELLDMGAITQEEFDAKKKELLGL